MSIYIYINDVRNARWQFMSCDAKGRKSFLLRKKKKNTEHPNGYSVFLANDCNFDTNAPLFEVRGKVNLEGVMHHIRPINPDLRL